MAIKSANVMARVEPDIKMRAEGIMASLGVPASVVINALYHQIIYTNGLPFSLTLPPSVPTIEDMSKEDFDNEMRNSNLLRNGLRCKRVMNQLKSSSTMKTENDEKDWVKVLYEVILKILTLGFYHVEKHRKN